MKSVTCRPDVADVHPEFFIHFRHIKLLCCLLGISRGKCPEMKQLVAVQSGDGLLSQKLMNTFELSVIACKVIHIRHNTKAAPLN